MSKAASSVAKLARMRVIALPLTSEASTTGLHTYYHFQTPPPVKSKGEPSLFKKTTDKVSGVWASFGKAPEGGWKHRTFTYGERIMDRIEFEELSLKSMDPSLGPKLSKLGKSDVSANVSEDEKETPLIPFIYPSFYDKGTPPLQHLNTLLKKRTPSHRKGFYTWLLVSPLTAPFMIIPVIPNLPFFFCLWRSWHHYRAFKASSYLESLLDSGVLSPEPNMGLDRIYEHNPPTSESRDKTNEPTSASREGEERIVLSREAVPKIIAAFELPSSAEADLYRALDQTESRLKKARS